MNSLRIRINIDQQAALLAGKVFGLTADIEINPSDFSPELWARLAPRINLSTTPATLNSLVPASCLSYSPKAKDATPAAFVCAVADAFAKIDSDIAKREAKNEATIAAYEADGINRVCHDTYGYRWEQWSVAYVVDYGLSEAHLARMRAHREKIRPIIEAHNAEHEAPCAEAKATWEARQAAAKAKADAESKAANVAKAARRLETGVWERETGSYNERRYGSPWCATVSFPTGPKPEYTFGESSGKWGKPGVMVLDCKPGDIIAHGQKDLRRPDNSDHAILIMRPDGSMRAIDRAEAYRLSQMPLDQRLAAI